MTVGDDTSLTGNREAGSIALPRFSAVFMSGDTPVRGQCVLLLYIRYVQGSIRSDVESIPCRDKGKQTIQFLVGKTTSTSCDEALKEGRDPSDWRRVPT